MYKELLTVPQEPEFTARILSYEVGDIHKLLIYAERFGSAGYLGDLQIACADAKTMINLLSEQLGYDLEEQKKLGLERFKERMEECKEMDKSYLRSGGQLTSEFWKKYVEADELEGHKLLETLPILKGVSKKTGLIKTYLSATILQGYIDDLINYLQGDSK